jgi:hypothetical protein
VLQTKGRLDGRREGTGKYSVTDFIFPASTSGFLIGNPCPLVSSLNFMLNSITLVGNEWIEALGNLSISPKPVISIALLRIQPALCPSSSVSACETNVRMVIEVDSSSDSGSSTSRYIFVLSKFQ